jgi:hypothetical protein
VAIRRRPPAQQRLADPSYEPTDEEFQELSRTAFANVKARHEVVLARLQEEIADAQRAEREALGLSA